MKVAITVWDERIAPVFDAAHSLLIADIKNRVVKKIGYESFDPRLEALLTQKLHHLQIDVFICGAISQFDSNLIEAIGIRLVPFISGNVNRILESWAKENSLIPEFLMPGCREDQPFV